MTHRIQQESIKRRLAKLAAPIFIETLLIMMLGAVDTIMLSRHSDNSVAAVGVYDGPHHSAMDGVGTRTDG